MVCSTLRHILVYGLILAVWMSSSGLSVVAVQVAGEAGRVMGVGGGDFPCAGRGCGCVSAQMCQTQCCCRSPRTKPAPAPESKPTSCCPLTAMQTTPALCPADQPEDSPTDPSTDHLHNQEQQTGFRVVIRSPECAGLVAWLMAKGATIHLPSPPVALTLWPLVAQLAVEWGGEPTSLRLTPEPPPPRRLA